jgi:two-component system cell cycle sensor histidine kinase/response regulator CckA
MAATQASAHAPARMVGLTRWFLRSELLGRPLRDRLARAEMREAELAARLRESERLRAELEVRLERLHESSGAVAHDVNNLLGVVALVASSLREQLPANVRELADELCDSAARAAKLNRRLLWLGRDDLAPEGPHLRRGAAVNAGAPSQSPPHPAASEGVDINLVIQGMNRLLRRLAGGTHDLVLTLDDQPCFARVDPGQLERVIVNLVTNARDAMSGRGRLTIETMHTKRPATHDDADDWHGGSVVVRVSDTGAGMDVATQRHIFEPFFTTKGASGTGLGLAAVQDIVARCGGRVRVESQPGGGTRFEIVLPVSPACGTLPASAPSSV